MTLWCLTCAMGRHLHHAAAFQRISTVFRNGRSTGLRHSTLASLRSWTSEVTESTNWHLRPCKLSNRHPWELFRSQKKTRHLGMILTDSLTWSPHVRDILKRVAYKAFILKRLAYRCRADGFVRHMFMTVVRPILEYASPVWDSCTKADALALERLQLSVARAIVKRGRRVASNSAVLEMIGWPTLAWRRRRLKLVLLWKLMHGHGPPALRAQLPTSVSARAKQSLRRDTLAMPLCRTQRRLQSFLPSTVALWNSLPSSVLSCTSLSSFLVSLDSQLISDRYSLGL